VTPPRATYRLQLHRDFTFSDAARQADYLAALGISHVYASPILAARAGSPHGYDVIDHSRVNPELGGEEGLRALMQALRQHGMGLIADIVPNHMAVGGDDNRWWLDVLEHGRGSPFANAFDIDWQAPGLEDKVLAPFLDGAPQAAWEKGDLGLARDPALGKWAVTYFQHRFPLRPEDQSLSSPPASWAEAEVLLARQHFALADWREADRRINWRRFFDITDLAALRMEEPSVFEAVHEKILALYGEGLIDGVRVDHIDGLADPAAYCRQLRRRLSALRPDPYMVVEKVLADGENLPADWEVDGTTGYDAMSDITALLHTDDDGALERLWHQTSGRDLSFTREEELARQEILDSKFVAQRNTAARAFRRALPDVSPEAIQRQLETAIIAPQPLFPGHDASPAVTDAMRRFRQLSVPVAAKAVEDTAFYRYGRLLSRNDLGFDPRRVFLAPVDFHTNVQRRARHFPQTMLTTATHDHKRGEDTRARLATLSARPQLWRDFIAQMPADPRVDPADTYILCQTLLGAWSSAPDAAFADRITGWCRKHLREAKLRSNWQSPDKNREDAFCALARRLILDAEAAPFRARLEALLAALAPLAEVNSLVQTVLRNTLPGVPDLYQGAEFTDLSLVDPDNRRPVDYAARRTALAEPLPAEASLDQRKQKLIALLLAARQHDPDLWQLGDYAPAETPSGFIAFQRRYAGRALFVVTRCNGSRRQATLTVPWAGQDILTGHNVPAGPYPAGTLLASWPALALLARDTAA
jgi:(1->4)-alpha-D-glucan 1-alpha-D-glucosylmutase